MLFPSHQKLFFFHIKTFPRNNIYVVLFNMIMNDNKHISKETVLEIKDEKTNNITECCKIFVLKI